MKKDRILRRNQVAKKLSIDVSTVSRWRKSGDLPEPDIEKPGYVGWKESTIEAFMDGR